MSGKVIKKDLRVRKTHMALTAAISSLLHRRNFNEITVNDLCTEALVSRAAFYTHFNDKYDLLRYMLTEVRTNIVKDLCNFATLERDVNHFVFSNKKLVSNVLKEANDETLKILRDFMSSILDLAIKRETVNVTDPQHIVLFHFFVGGLITLLTWIVENNFPPEVTIVNSYLYSMLDAMITWDADQAYGDTCKNADERKGGCRWKA